MPEPTPCHERVTRLRRRVWRRLDRAVRSLVGRPSAELQAYERRYRLEMGASARPVGREQVLAAVASAPIVLCGDYHTYRPSQAACLDLLAHLAAHHPRVVLLVELALSAHQPHLDAYGQGRIDQTGLLERLDYRRTWGFSWNGYGPLLEYARLNGVPIVGLNGPGTALASSLAERDAWAAGILARTRERFPDARLLVLAGDLHLAAAHLPRELGHRLGATGPAPAVVRVFQNSDDIYWRLAATGLEAESVEIGAGTFCLFNGTPWAKLESYLTWLEDGDDPAAELGLSGAGVFDLGDRLYDLIALLARFLDLDPGDAHDWEVVTADDRPFLAALASDPARAGLARLLVDQDVLLLPEQKRLFLARLDLGHVLAGAARVLVESSRRPDPGATTPQRVFLGQVLDRGLAAFAARLLEPYGSTAAAGQPSRIARNLVETHARSVLGWLEERRPAHLPAEIPGDDRLLHQAIATAAGERLGTRLYHAFRDDACGLGELQPLFLRRGDLADPGRALARLVSLYRAAGTGKARLVASTSAAPG